jgi:hypothetical protein
MAAAVLIRQVELRAANALVSAHGTERKARIYHRRVLAGRKRACESLKYSGKDEIFHAPFMHYLNPTLVHHELKYLRYAELKARDWHDKQRSCRPCEWPWVFAATFFKDYSRLAVLDGWAGLQQHDGGQLRGVQTHALIRDAAFSSLNDLCHAGVAHDLER